MRGILLIWIILGHGHAVFLEGVGGNVFLLPVIPLFFLLLSVDVD